MQASNVLRFSNPAAPNPRRRRKATRRRRRRNAAAAPAPAVHASNPRRRRYHYRRRRNPAAAAMYNPRVTRINRRRRRRHNPAFLSNISHHVKAALPVIGGIYLTRYGTRAILGARDQGVVGYGAAALLALALGAGARVLGMPGAAPGLVTGGIAAVGLRVLVDQLPSVAERAGLGLPELDMYSRYGGVADYLNGGGVADYLNA